MKGYWIAHVTLTDPDAYQDYLALAPAALAKYGAKILSRGEHFTPLEGFDDAPPHRAVVFEFESYQQALDCYHSPEYQAAREKRLASANAHILILQGQA
jgi:uncharacterized protein (DUF1330 family)